MAAVVVVAVVVAVIMAVVVALVVALVVVGGGGGSGGSIAENWFVCRYIVSMCMYVSYVHIKEHGVQW